MNARTNDQTNDETPAPVHSSPALLLLTFAAACVFSAAAAAQVRPAPLPPVAPADTPAPRVAPAPARPTRGERTEAARNHPHTPEVTAGRNLHLGPTGRWWDDGNYTRTLAISTSQQLLKLYTNLKHQQSELDKLGKTADETALDQQIDRVSQARTDLEKADTHLLLEIRKQLTPDQVGKLDAAQQ